MVGLAERRVLSVQSRVCIPDVCEKIGQCIFKVYRTCAVLYTLTVQYLSCVRLSTLWFFLGEDINIGRRLSCAESGEKGDDNKHMMRGITPGEKGRPTWSWAKRPRLGDEEYTGTRVTSRPHDRLALSKAQRHRRSVCLSLVTI